MGYGGSPEVGSGRRGFYPARMSTLAGHPAPQRLYLHIGVPKSGTSFLQATLRANADRLRERGYLFPASQHRGLFHAALELTGNQPGWGVPDRRVKGSWAGLCRRARAFDGSSIFSNELFSNVKAGDIPAALEHLAGLEVHLVVTARDLARQLPAEWQEGVKHGRAVGFGAFLRRILDPQRRHEHSRRFWQHQDLAGLLERWAVQLPPERIHVVTCPPTGAPRELLWERFCEVVGLDPAGLELPESGANTSLGITAVDVLARVNRDLRRTKGVHPSQVRRTLKKSVVNGALRSDTSPRVVVPADRLPSLEAITADWVERIEAAGYDVVGDLADLTPRPASSGVDPPHKVRPRESRDLAVHVVATLAREVAELQSRLAKAEAKHARAAAKGGPGVVRSAARRVADRLRRD